jgi:hypothetical protein
MAVTEGYISKVKAALRVSTTDSSIKAEITGLIEAARRDLELAGVLPDKTISESDSLIERAVITYCKANFGLSNPDMERYYESYKMIKKHLLMSEEYTTDVE